MSVKGSPDLKGQELEDEMQQTGDEGDRDQIHRRVGYQPAHIHTYIHTYIHT